MLDYLRRRVEVTNSKSIRISHNEIAKEMGTVREVVSRVLKKLEIDGSVSQGNHTITFL